MIRYLLIFSGIALFFSCSKKETEPAVYSIGVKNKYFETIDSVRLGNSYVGKIAVDSLSKPLSIRKGRYGFYCITLSGLRITAPVVVRGAKVQLTIKVNKRGRVELG